MKVNLENEVQLMTLKKILFHFAFHQKFPQTLPIVLTIVAAPAGMTSTYATKRIK